MTAHINIGSNLGDRTANICRAATLIESSIGPITARSAIIESAPWGYESAHAFLNQGINVSTSLRATQIVSRLKIIEQTIAPHCPHRYTDGSYLDRIIDLDLISLDALVNNDSEATVPHPRMHLRDFVLRPMAEILPQWRHPLLNFTPQEMLNAIIRPGDALK